MLPEIANHGVGSLGFHHQGLAGDEDGLKPSRTGVTCEGPEDAPGASSVPLEDPAKMFGPCGHPFEVGDNNRTQPGSQRHVFLGQNRGGGCGFGLG